jgi:hypothetical protein
MYHKEEWLYIAKKGGLKALFLEGVCGLYQRILKSRMILEEFVRWLKNKYMRRNA